VSSERGGPIGSLHHVGILVADLDRAKRLFVDVLGLEVSSEAYLEELDLNVAFLDAGSIQLELIEIRDTETRERRLAGRAACLDHLAFQVEEVEHAAARVEGRGIATAAGPGEDAPPGEVLRLPASNSVFSVPDTSLDLLVQLLEPNRDSADHA
jgi:glyoxylase I family protein